MTKEEAREYLKMGEDDEITDFHVFLAETWQKADREYEGIPWEPFAYYNVTGDLLKVHLSENEDGCWHWRKDHTSVAYSHSGDKTVVGWDIWWLKSFLNGEPRENVTYDKEMDTIRFTIVPGASFYSKEDVSPSITVMKDKDGKIVASELRGVTRLVREEELKEEGR
jgi:hypothetical protein